MPNVLSCVAFKAGTASKSHHDEEDEPVIVRAALEERCRLATHLTVGVSGSRAGERLL